MLKVSFTYWNFLTFPKFVWGENRVDVGLIISTNIWQLLFIMHISFYLLVSLLLEEQMQFNYHSKIATQSVVYWPFSGNLLEKQILGLATILGNQNAMGEGQHVSFNKPSGWLWWPWKCEKLWSKGYWVSPESFLSIQINPLKWKLVGI